MCKHQYNVQARMSQKDKSRRITPCSLSVCLSLSVGALTHLHMNAVTEMRLDLVKRLSKNYYVYEANEAVSLAG